MTTLPPRAKYFASTVVVQLFALAISLAVAFAFRFQLYPPTVPKATDVLLGIAAAAALALLMAPRWKAAVRTGDRRLHFFMPQGAKEKAWWVGVSAAAGVGEETTYRGALYLVVLLLTGNLWVAALASALLFAAAHAFQSLRSMAIIFGFALVFQWLALRTGSLYVPMLAHFLYDVTAGFAYSRLGREMGYRPEGVAVAASTEPRAEAPSAVRTSSRS